MCWCWTAARGASIPHDQLVLCAGSILAPPGEGIHCADRYEQALALREAIGAVPEPPPLP